MAKLIINAWIWEALVVCLIITASRSAISWQEASFWPHWGLNKMATISQTTFSDAFIQWKFRFWIKISLNFFLGVQLTRSQLWFRLWLVASQATSHNLNQRCVVRGIALSSLLSCRLLANLNSRGSSAAPTWAHLCWPGSRSVHGSIHSCVIGRPRFARRGHPKYYLGCLAGHAGRRAWTRASESSQPAAQTSCPEPARRVSFAWVRR